MNDIMLKGLFVGVAGFVLLGLVYIVVVGALHR